MLQRTSQQGFKADIYNIQEKNIKVNLSGGVGAGKRGRRRQLLTISPQAMSMGTPTSSMGSFADLPSNIKTMDIIKGVDDLSYLQCVNILIPLRSTTDQGCVVFSELQFVQPTHLHTSPLRLSDQAKSLPVSPKQSTSTLTFTLTDSDSNAKRHCRFHLVIRCLLSPHFKTKRTHRSLKCS